MCMPQQEYRKVKIFSRPSSSGFNINWEVQEFLYLEIIPSHKLKLNTCKILYVDPDL